MCHSTFTKPISEVTNLQLTSPKGCQFMNSCQPDFCHVACPFEVVFEFGDIESCSIFVCHSFGTYMGVSKNRGTPKWMVYNGKLIKTDDLGVPLFLETPI